MVEEVKTKVIIAGGGIAGPVLAILLKSKGYETIVYEKVDTLTDVGLSLWYALLAAHTVVFAELPPVCSPMVCVSSGSYRV